MENNPVLTPTLCNDNPVLKAAPSSKNTPIQETFKTFKALTFLSCPYKMTITWQATEASTNHPR